MEVSQRVKVSQLEVVRLGTRDEVRPVHVAKEMSPEDKSAMITLLKEFRDVFAWSYEDMWGLDPQLYQHQIHLSKDLTPNYINISGRIPGTLAYNVCGNRFLDQHDQPGHG